MNSARIRVVGILSWSQRGAMLTTLQSEVWIIETDEDLDTFLGKTILVEGTISGLDRLSAYWIGELKG
ncbi:DUF5818 domain-containing protein [Novosphingobium percolationis]|uniref:DUF5818 domain-containing protein n=1 Tax=Novosphingobium percolationis TaxID=2871811 RepID=UPI001CD73CA0|nr:DUF5818 domain-containing protein [Novosphingobium percolationis]